MHFRKGSCCGSQWGQSEDVEGRRGGGQGLRLQSVLWQRLGREGVHGGQGLRDNIEILFKCLILTMIWLRLVAGRVIGLRMIAWRMVAWLVRWLLGFVLVLLLEECSLVWFV